jgi:hypothetical protein
LMSFSGQPGGTCQGDSGGPGLVTVNGQEYVAGVTSYGAPGCKGVGVDGRISPFVECFVNAYIAGAPIVANCGKVASIFPPGTPACSSCVATAKMMTCMGADAACKAEPACDDYGLCTGVCAETDTACFKLCATTYPTGKAVLDKLNDCYCFQACPSECVVECNGPKGMCA